MSGLIITPETKVGDLLDGYPEAEAALIDIAPKFKALKNPVLRRTVAKLATLEQAARVAEIPVNELVRSLRQVLGQEAGEPGADGGPRLDGLEAPAWIADGAKIDFDADALLAQGATPVGKASEVLTGMDAGEILLVRSSFQAAPLIDALRGKGHEVFTRKVGAEAWEAWVKKAD